MASMMAAGAPPTLPLADNGCKQDDACVADEVVVPKEEKTIVQNSESKATTVESTRISNATASTTPSRAKKQQLGGLMSILKAGLWNNVLKFEGASGAAVNAPFVSKTTCV